MLVISRRKGQRVTIGDEIELVITELHKSHVKVGITAPRGFTVLRGEVHDSIKTANRAAAESELDEPFEHELLIEGDSDNNQTLLAARQQDGAQQRQGEHGKPLKIEVVIRRRRASEEEEASPDEVASA
jgi:carbon storage regulator